MTDQREQPGCDPRSSALGLARVGLVLSPFRSEWEVCFQNEREGILECIGPLACMPHRFPLNGYFRLDDSGLWPSAKDKASLEDCSAETSKRQAREAVLSLRSARSRARARSRHGSRSALPRITSRICETTRLVTRVEHVGSTAVHGMIAKPILDIGIAVEDFDEARACIAPLESRLGYTFMGERGIPRRHYFVKGEPRTHHIHMVEAHCEEWMRMIRFRDRLRESSELADEYAKLKLRLMRQLGADRKAYQEGKSDFIRSVLGQ